MASVEVQRGDRLHRGQVRAWLLQGSAISPQKVDELRTNFRVAQQDHATAELNHQVAILELARAIFAGTADDPLTGGAG